MKFLFRLLKIVTGILDINWIVLNFDIRRQSDSESYLSDN